MAADPELVTAIKTAGAMVGGGLALGGGAIGAAVGDGLAGAADHRRRRASAGGAGQLPDPVPDGRPGRGHVLHQPGLHGLSSSSSASSPRMFATSASAARWRPSSEDDSNFLIPNATFIAELVAFGLLLWALASTCCRR